MIFKILYNHNNPKIKAILRRVHLYHPSLKRLSELSKGSPETLVDRSNEFSSLLHGLWINGVDKRTGLGRLALLDEWLISFLQQPKQNSICLLDVGASDGSTTYDLLRFLQKSLGIEIKATILERQLRLHSYKSGWLRYYLTHDMKPFIIQLGPFGVILEESRGKMRFLFNPFVVFIRKTLKWLRLEQHLKNEGDLLLMSPIVKENLNLKWIEQDLFKYNESMKESFDLIRCCNILNINYFSNDQITGAINILSSYLKQDGMLLVARSGEDLDGLKITASIWKKSSSGLVHQSDMNGGSEIKSIFANINQVD